MVDTQSKCEYCGTVEHRATAWTANGRDLERFERWHPVSDHVPEEEEKET